jgi:hypothetical protein
LFNVFKVQNRKKKTWLRVFSTSEALKLLTLKSSQKSIELTE